jgi:hypothetical protein
MMVREKDMMANPKWLEWAQNLQALAQSGLTYSPNPFDHERYGTILEIAAEIVSIYSQTDLEGWPKRSRKLNGHGTLLKTQERENAWKTDGTTRAI